MNKTQIQAVMTVYPATGLPVSSSDGSGGNLQVKGVWDRIPGNSIEFTYYTGAAAGNPSGSTSNIETATYKDDGVTSFTQTFTYDGNDNILTLTVA